MGKIINQDPNANKSLPANRITGKFTNDKCSFPTSSRLSTVVNFIQYMVPNRDDGEINFTNSIIISPLMVKLYHHSDLR